MSDKNAAGLFRIQSRFLRSAHLERDFDDSTALSGYIPTDFTCACLERLVEGVKPRSGHRAWRLTGEYGSGKSSFALLLAHWLSGRDSDFPPQLRKVVDYHRYGIARPRFAPVLVTCARQALGVSILKSLQCTLAQLYGRRSKLRLLADIQHSLSGKREPTDDRVIDFLLQANARVIADSKGRGLVLILDELGKFLEFVAQHPDRHDVFVLQRLAEIASRSGDEPLFIVCLLHQGFSAYAHDLTQSAQREWEKVAGRFEEIVFSQPVDQITELIASALNVRLDLIPKPQVGALKQAMAQTIALGWFGNVSVDSLEKSAARVYPLHPTVLPVLIRAFRRFGQNERSLFSFLLSNEPYGLQAAAHKCLRDVTLYRLPDLFDYLRTNFGHRLSALSFRSHWSLIESVVESFATDDELHIQVLKTVGVLNLLNDSDLVATEESIVAALAGEDSGLARRVRSAVAELRQGKRVLYDRGRVRGLCLWPHTSVDLEKAREEACRAVETPKRVGRLIAEFLETRPIVARKHYIETGNLRYFDVRYSPVTELPALLEQSGIVSDGMIVIPLCENLAERTVALEFAQRPELKKRHTWLVAVPPPLSHLTGLVQEVQRWEWVAHNTPELNGDRYASEEVSRQIAAAREQLERRIHSLIGLQHLTGRMELDWYHMAQPIEIGNGRVLLRTLSELFDKAYRAAPHIHNELVNRRALSSAAAAGRMRLIERMFAAPNAVLLGMDSSKKPPAMSMYLSVLKNTGLHQHDGETWQIGEPLPDHDKCHVTPALKRIHEIIQKEPDSRVNVAALFDQLRQPPYGVRDGIIPLLLTVFAIANEQEVAFYKDGTFLRELNSEAMLLLTKAPERFDIQYCRIEGVRAVLFGKLCAVLDVAPNAHRKTELLDVVKPLCVFVAQLPPYVHNTKRLSLTTLAVRDAILNAREPVKLLFTDLPKSCGFQPFTNASQGNKPVQEFASALKAALDELRAAYPELQDRLRKELRDAFSLPGDFRQFRTAVAARAGQVVIGVTEPKLKALCFRLSDTALSDAEWLESVGSHLTLKPPARWLDTDETVFIQELREMASRFHRVESVVFADSKVPNNSIGIRVAITQANGLEHQQVIHVSSDEEQQLREIQTQVEALLARDRRLGLAAVSRALWSNMENVENPKNE